MEGDHVYGRRIAGEARDGGTRLNKCRQETLRENLTFVAREVLSFELSFFTSCISIALGSVTSTGNMAFNKVFLWLAKPSAINLQAPSGRG